MTKFIKSISPDRVWGDVRFNGGGLGSIAKGTLRERFWCGAIDRCLDSIWCC
jgi:hypothetical protein